MTEKEFNLSKKIVNIFGCVDYVYTKDIKEFIRLLKKESYLVCKSCGSSKDNIEKCGRCGDENLLWVVRIDKLNKLAGKELSK